MICSVLIPSRGRPDGLHKAIRSIFATATTPEVEVLIRLDDDDEASLARQHEFGQYPRTSVHVGPRMGGYLSLNVMYEELARLATGKWIFIMNDDAWVEGVGWDQRVNDFPTSGVILQPEVIANYQHDHLDVVPCVYPLCEGGPFPIVPNGCWHDLGWTVLRDPLDIELDKLLRKENGWRTDFVKGLTLCHARDPVPPPDRAPKPVVGNAFDYFSSILCVNLDRRTDRWSQAQEELIKCGLADRCQRFSGFDHPTSGSWGCTTSHRMLWQRISTGEFGDRVLVLEDDFKLLTREDLLGARFSGDSSVMRIFDGLSCEEQSTTQWLDCRLRTMLSEVPESWDLLYLGGSYMTTPKYRISRHVIRNAGMHTTHAYAIGPRLAKAITGILGSDVVGSYHGGVDSILCGFCEEFISLTLSPRLFIQRPDSKSDITGLTGGFPFSMTDSAHEEMV